MSWPKLAVVVVALVVTIFGVVAYQNQRADAARQACEQLNQQHDLQTAMSGGQYTWPHKDC